MLLSISMHLRHFGQSDVGQLRSHNEDAFLADPDLGVFIVCDGVGGQAHGEIASRETAKFIWEWVKREEAIVEQAREKPNDELATKLCQILRGAVQNACYMVHGLGQLDPTQQGMSTTASVLLVCGPVAIVGQVGDSRVYLRRDKEVYQLTEDHTLLNFQLKHGLITEEQAKRSTAKNIITRAVGHRDYVEVDVSPISLLPDDRLMLCSDGLHGYIEDPNELREILELDVEEAARKSIRLANDRGGGDNITVLMVDYLGRIPPVSSHG